jgi:NitT/TauT family transport system substrate-binding protein
VADVATHAETQALRYSVRHPNLRIILNVSQGLYRIVARKSAGIASVADLKGKKIVTIAPTSSGYFLSRMLAREQLGFADIQPTSLQPGQPLSAMPGMLARGEADAVVIWEPESENSVLAIGDDAIEFHGDEVYSEQFNLNTTAENLADPKERAKIVAFLRGVIRAAADIRRDPAEAKRLVVAAGGFKPEEVERSWKHHAFTADYPANMLDILAEEEKWLAQQDKRTPRGREELAQLIDTSAYEEALALEKAQ